MRVLGVTLALIVFIAVAFAPGGNHLPLDPDEPAAADGSLIAGRMRTIFDFDPVLGDFTKSEPADNLDDPKQVANRIAIEKPWADRSRDTIVQLLGPMDESFCEEAQRTRLIAAIRTYYDARGRQKASFGWRGLDARATIDQAWSTPADRRIDEFARQLVESGFLRLRDVPQRSYPEFARVIAGTKVVGAACPELKAESR